MSPFIYKVSVMFCFTYLCYSSFISDHYMLTKFAKTFSLTQRSFAKQIFLVFRI